MKIVYQADPMLKRDARRRNLIENPLYISARRRRKLYGGFYWTGFFLILFLAFLLLVFCRVWVSYPFAAWGLGFYGLLVILMLGYALLLKHRHFLFGKHRAIYRESISIEKDEPQTSSVKKKQDPASSLSQPYAASQPEKSDTDHAKTDHYMLRYEFDFDPNRSGKPQCQAFCDLSELEHLYVEPNGRQLVLEGVITLLQNSQRKTVRFLKIPLNLDGNVELLTLLSKITGLAPLGIDQLPAAPDKSAL